ncbi:MAG: hypothetical protein KGZ86_01950 [Candidatus Latescibacteria bacterium]|nr:hypothetical protein [Candidatus Latescibacterota bacterium]
MNFLELPKEMAYLDPGSGSLVLQLVLAALLGLGIFVRSQWRKIKALFGRKEPTQQDKDENDSAGQE